MFKIKDYCYCCAEKKKIKTGDLYCKECKVLIKKHGFSETLDIMEIKLEKNE